MTDELTKYVPIQALIIQYDIMKAKFEKMFADIDTISKDLETLIGNLRRFFW